MAFLPWVLLGVGTLTSATGTYMQGQAQADAAEQRGDAARINAANTIIAYKEKERAYRREAARKMSTQRTLYGASGLDIAGSPLDVLADQAFEFEKEARAIRWQGSQEVFKWETEAGQADAFADSARKTSILGAGATILSGLGQAALSYRDSGGSGRSRYRTGDYASYF